MTDTARCYTIFVKINKYGPLIATSADGNLLKVLDKRPLWIDYPGDDPGALRDDIHDSRWIRPLNWLQIVPP
jgi:hypothetical protein